MAAYHRIYDYVTCGPTAFDRDQLWVQRSFPVWVTITFFILKQSSVRRLLQIGTIIKPCFKSLFKTLPKTLSAKDSALKCQSYIDTLKQNL